MALQHDDGDEDWQYRPFRINRTNVKEYDSGDIASVGDD